MGTTFKSITEGTFNSFGAGYRPTPWAPKADGSGPSILQKNTVLSKAFHLEVTSTHATLRNATIYAAIHQYGGVIRPKTAKRLSWVGPGGKRIFAMKVTIPPRPFFPVLGDKLTAAAEDKIARAGARVIASQNAAAV